MTEPHGHDLRPPRRRPGAAWAFTVFFGVDAVALLALGVRRVLVGPDVWTGAMMLLFALVAASVAMFCWPGRGPGGEVCDQPLRTTLRESTAGLAATVLLTTGVPILAVPSVLVSTIGAGDRAVAGVALGGTGVAVAATWLRMSRVRPARLALTAEGIEYTDATAVTVRAAWRDVVRVQERGATVVVVPRRRAAERSVDGSAWTAVRDRGTEITIATLHLPVPKQWLLSVLRERSGNDSRTGTDRSP